MRKRIECDCGWVFEGEEQELVDATIEHGREVHQMTITREQALAAARPVTQPDQSAS